MKKWIIAAAALAYLCAPARAETAFEDDLSGAFRIVDPQNRYVAARAGRVYEGDEYISSDNLLYRISFVDEARGEAVAECLGEEPAADRAAFLPLRRAQAANKLVCMYSTHSDESYVPTDGTSSKEEGAGIYDVGDALKENLEKKGIEVEYAKETFLPHDSGAYRRSASTAGELARKAPAALFDLHRDGIPDASEYEHEVEGEQASKIRLEVGRSNQNADANRAFAKEIKRVADEKYPGLIKDIYIGKGNYNQELYPKALLLEFGTHTIDKDRAVESTKYMADVIDETLFGPSASASAKAESKGAGKGVYWLVGLSVAAALIYALAATGTFRGMKEGLARGASEISGGLFGKKPKK